MLKCQISEIDKFERSESLAEEQTYFSEGSTHLYFCFLYSSYPALCCCNAAAMLLRWPSCWGGQGLHEWIPTCRACTEAFFLICDLIKSSHTLSNRAHQESHTLFGMAYPPWAEVQLEIACGARNHRQHSCQTQRSEFPQSQDVNGGQWELELITMGLQGMRSLKTTHTHTYRYTLFIQPSQSFLIISKHYLVDIFTKFLRFVKTSQTIQGNLTILSKNRLKTLYLYLNKLLLHFRIFHTIQKRKGNTTFSFFKCVYN